MPRHEDCDRGERRYDKGGGYAPLGGNQYNRGGRTDVGGLDAGGARLYIGRLSSRTRSQDLEDLFSRYGRVRDVDMKHNFAFVEFLDARDADDARHYTNGKDLDGSRLIVEFARRRVMDPGPRGLGGVREYLGRGPLPGSGRCYNCGNEGHWARDCKAGDWRDKCYRCGQRGHIERNCRKSPVPNSSLSRSRSRSPRKPQKARSQSRSRSYSLSPSRKADRVSPLKDSQKGSKSRSLSPAAKIRSVSASPARNNVSASQSPAHHSHSPEHPQVEVETLLVQESRQELSRSLSRSPGIIDMEKLSPARVDESDKSPVTPISEE